jgi:hypothetical protein
MKLLFQGYSRVLGLSFFIFCIEDFGGCNKI